MPRSRPKSAARPELAKPYHHGHLVEALVAATIEIIEERGIEFVSVREAAKRAGVSPGAPFRHFKTKTVLMTAVAEQAMGRLKASVTQALAAAGRDDPMAAFEAIGVGYLTWATDNPTHFEIISSRTLIDFDGSVSLRRDNDDIRQLMVDLLEQARVGGRLSPGLAFDQIVLTARALVYGLARMAADGHFPEWHAATPPHDAMRQSLRLFIRQIARA